MGTLEKRVQTLEDNIFVDNNRELPSEIQALLRRVNQGSEGIVVSPEQQREIDCYVAELIALAQQKG